MMPMNKPRAIDIGWGTMALPQALRRAGNSLFDAGARIGAFFEIGRRADVGAFAKPTDNVPLGILYMILATVLFAVSSAIAKWQVAIYPVGEVMFFRSISSLAVCAAVVLPVTGFAVFATKRHGAHIARGLSQSISQTFTVIAFSLMPLAGAIAINFSAPLWAALLSIVWLKERAGPARWTVLLTGFSGVLIVANPGADAFQIGALFALANAVMYGSVTVAVRGMTATEIGKHPFDVADGHHRYLSFFSAGVWVPLADGHRRDHAGALRRGERGRAVCLDQVALAGADDRGVPLLLLLAGLGDGDRFCGVGRRADHGASDRIGDRRRLGTVPALARGPAEGRKGAVRLRSTTVLDSTGRSSREALPPAPPPRTGSPAPRRSRAPPDIPSETRPRRLPPSWSCRARGRC